MLHFPSNLEEVQLSLVPLLLLLGGPVTLSTSHIARFSKLNLLPTVLPGLQTLLESHHLPPALQPITGYVTGVKSGRQETSLPYHAHVLL
jgi:hypothetical protein